MADKPSSGPDPVVDSDRGAGTTPPESGPESTTVVGRPAVERQPFNEREAAERGGSFDAVVPPGKQPGG